MSTRPVLVAAERMKRPDGGWRVRCRTAAHADPFGAYGSTFWHGLLPEQGEEPNATTPNHPETR